LKSLRLDRTSITVKFVGVLQLIVSECNPRLLHFWGRSSFSRNASGQHTKMFIYFKFGVYWLN